MLVVGTLACAPVAFGQDVAAPAGPREWVAYAADIHIVCLPAVSRLVDQSADEDGGVPAHAESASRHTEGGCERGFDAYVNEARVRSPKGDYVAVSTVIPALNFFHAADDEARRDADHRRDARRYGRRQVIKFVRASQNP